MKFPKIKFSSFNIKNLIYKLVLGDVCRELLRSWEENGSDWTYNEYWLTNKQNEVKLWIGNGRFFFDVFYKENTEYTESGLVGLFERHIMWHEFKKRLKHTKKSRKQMRRDEVIKKLKTTTKGTV